MPDAIAIDFGTSRTKLAYRHPGTEKPELMRLGHEDRPFIPSLFYLFRDSERLLWGDDAQQMLEDDPVGVVEALKRHLQDRFVFANRQKRKPVELLTALLHDLRERAAQEVPALEHRAPDKVLLTKPVLYGPPSEKVLREAAKAAGFKEEEVELVDEPVAAAHAWLAETGEKAQAVVVLDCGGGTLDWAYLQREGEDFRVVTECPPGGDWSVGGQDVDEELLALVRERLGEAADAAIEERKPYYLQQLRTLKERYSRGLPLRPLKVGDQAVTLREEDLQAVIEERYIGQVCEHLKRYLERVKSVAGGALPTVLLVGGSARLKGLRAAIEAQCGCQTAWWERSEYATVLGAARRSGPTVVEMIHGWSTERVQALQRATAKALGRPVVFRDWLKDGSEGPEMVVIPAGRFIMGSPQDEPGRSDEEGPQHAVTIGKPFGLGRYAVTFEDYDRYCAATGIKQPDDAGWGRP
jgi:molecular chaperone DnaK (HSP70)